MRSPACRSSQRTIVICTHNLAEAEALADIIAIIYRGRILLAGTLEELKEKCSDQPSTRRGSPLGLELGWTTKCPGVSNDRRESETWLRFSVPNPQRIQSPY